jgi:hypothetical protein
MMNTPPSNVIVLAEWRRRHKSAEPALPSTPTPAQTLARHLANINAILKPPARDTGA